MQVVEPTTLLLPQALPAETPRAEDRPRRPRRRRAAPRWELHTPELRYDVASLQHWLDLNG